MNEFPRTLIALGGLIVLLVLCAYASFWWHRFKKKRMEEDGTPKVGRIVKIGGTNFVILHMQFEGVYKSLRLELQDVESYKRQHSIELEGEILES